jgi:hypothetical protein
MDRLQFLGGGRHLSVTGTYSNVNSTFDLKLLQPRLFTPEFSLILEDSGIFPTTALAPTIVIGVY